MNIIFPKLTRKAAMLAASLSMIVTPPFATARAAEPSITRSAKAGKSLYELVYNPGDDKIYVAAIGDWGKENASINVIDPVSLKIVRQLSLGGNALLGLGLNTRTQTLYGTSSISGTVTVIDAQSGKVLTTITDPANPKAHVRKVAVDETSNKIYVSVVGGFSYEPGKEAPKSAIWVIDGHRNALEDIIVDPVETATGLALDPKADRLYVADMTKNQVGVFDLATRKPVTHFRAYDESSVTIEISEFSGKRENGAQNIAVDTKGHRLFVTNPGSGTLTVIDSRTGRLLKTVKTGSAPLDVAWNAASRQVYVTNRGNGDNGTVTVVDGRSYAILAQLKTGTYPQTIAVDPAGKAVYVSNKAKGLPRGAAPGTPAPEDLDGDTIAVIRP